jgi:hypothetical protein
VIRIKILFDKYNRTFKLVDKTFAPLLNDGDVYELLLPLNIEQSEEQEQPIIDESSLAHA